MIGICARFRRTPPDIADDIAAELASSTIHELVQITVELESRRLDNACGIGLAAT
jgi:hypothetical protein